MYILNDINYILSNTKTDIINKNDYEAYINNINNVFEYNTLCIYFCNNYYNSNNSYIENFDIQNFINFINNLSNVKQKKCIGIYINKHIHLLYYNDYINNFNIFYNSNNSNSIIIKIIDILYEHKIFIYDYENTCFMNTS